MPNKKCSRPDFAEKLADVHRVADEVESARAESKSVCMPKWSAS
jgi:hypothetical protein